MNKNYLYELEELKHKDTLYMHTTAEEELEVEMFIETWADYLRQKNIEAIMSLYNENITIFDILSPIELKGIDIIRKKTQDWLDSFVSQITISFKGLKVHAYKDSAFAYSIIRFQGAKSNNIQEDMSIRITWGLQKIEKDWFIIHEHTSVPFQP